MVCIIIEAASSVPMTTTTIHVGSVIVQRNTEEPGGIIPKLLTGAHVVIILTVSTFKLVPAAKTIVLKPILMVTTTGVMAKTYFGVVLPTIAI